MDKRQRKNPAKEKAKAIKKVMAKYLYSKILYTDGPNMGKFGELTPAVLAGESLDNYVLILRHFTKMSKEEKVALATLTATPEYCITNTIRPTDTEREYFTVMYNTPANSLHDHVKLVVKLTAKKDISLTCEVYDFAGKKFGHTLAKKIPVRNLMAVREFFEGIGIVIPYGALNNKTLVDVGHAMFEGSKALKQELEDIAEALKHNPMAQTVGGEVEEEYEDDETEDDDNEGGEDEGASNQTSAADTTNQGGTNTTNEPVLPPLPD